MAVLEFPNSGAQYLLVDVQPIVTMTKVTFSEARWMVEALGAVAEELLL